MSYTTILGVTPGQTSEGLLELRNAHGWAPSIWQRLLSHYRCGRLDYAEGGALDLLWRAIGGLPEWDALDAWVTPDDPAPGAAMEEKS